MTDGYLKFANSPLGQWLARSAGLPRPLPLRRQRDGESEFVGPIVLGAGAGGRFGAVLPRLLDAAGIARVEPAGGGAMNPVQGLVFDASGIADSMGLDELYRFFHTYARRIEANGRVLVLGTPPEDCPDLGTAVAQRALEGLTRSLGKELRKAITAQLLYLRPGAETALESSLRFFLSHRSAYVSGQVLRIGAALDTPAPFAWERPLSGRRALVTGAARGIGQAIASLLAAQGAQVTCLDVPQAEPELRQTAEALGGRWLSLDVGAAEAERALREEALAQGGLDIVVHNAGITRDKTIARMSQAQWREVLAVNLEAPLRLSQALLSEGLRPGGRIIGVSSIAGIAGNVGQTNYATSKAGVIGLVQHLAPHTAERGITVNAVAPGFIETRLTAAIPLLIREAGRRMNSLAQGGQPIDVAEAIGWFAHPASGGVNGQVLRVCGQSLLGA